MSAPRIRRLGVCEYLPVWQEMQAFVNAAAGRGDTREEIWLLQHRPVFTLGKSGRREHLLRARADVPLVHSDRGGQITYHAPGQVVVYVLFNIARRRCGLRAFVRGLEGAVVQCLAGYGVHAVGDVAAPGVYVDGAKIAALGLRIRHGWTYHGVSLNVQMDLSPFKDINPCGYAGLEVTQLADLVEAVPAVEEVGEGLVTATLDSIGD